MKILAVAIFVALIVFSVCVANAADVTLTWQAPVANADGSTPPLAAGYNVYFAATDAALTALPDSLHGTIPNGPSMKSVGNVLTYTFKSVVPGTYFYAVTTWFCPSVPNPCVESIQSAHVSTTVSPPVITPKTPGSPGSVTISATVSAP